MASIDLSNISVGNEPRASDWLDLGLDAEGRMVQRNTRTGEIRKTGTVGAHPGGGAAPRPAASTPSSGGMMPFPSMPTMPSMPAPGPSPAASDPSMGGMSDSMAPSMAALDQGSGAGATQQAMGGLRPNLGNRLYPSLERLLNAKAY